MGFQGRDKGFSDRAVISFPHLDIVRSDSMQVSRATAGSSPGLVSTSASSPSSKPSTAGHSDWTRRGLDSGAPTSACEIHPTGTQEHDQDVRDVGFRERLTPLVQTEHSWVTPPCSSRVRERHDARSSLPLLRCRTRVPALGLERDANAQRHTGPARLQGYCGKQGIQLR